MTRKEFMKMFDGAKEVPWDEKIRGIKGVYIMPTRRKHSSGYAVMRLLFVLKDETMIKSDDCCDVVDIRGCNFKIDCMYPSGILHLFTWREAACDYRLSSVDLYETNEERQ